MGIVHVTGDAVPSDRSAIEGDGFTATVGRFDAPGGAGAWHHHGDHHIVAYLISGTVRIEWGPGGVRTLEPSPGDLIHIEPGTVHRETYEGRIELIGFTAGSGPGRVDVEGPDAIG